MKIKYYGRADVRVISAGENWNGLLAEPLENELRWDRSTNWILDTEVTEVPEAVITLLLADESFVDVTEEAIVPVNEAQHFIGMSDPEGVESRAGTVDTEAAEQERLNAQIARNAPAPEGDAPATEGAVPAVGETSSAASATTPPGSSVSESGSTGGSGNDAGGGRRGSKS